MNFICTEHTLITRTAPWCSICAKFKPVWNEITKKYQNHSNIHIALVNCVAEQDLCQHQDIIGYPTINLYKNGTFYTEYEGNNKLSVVTDFVESHQVKETEQGWAEREAARQVLHDVNKKKRAEKRALEAKNSIKAEALTSKSSCNVPAEDKNGLCVATYNK